MTTEIFEALSDKLAGISGVEHVDIWDNQIQNEYEGRETPYPVPAVFIDFESTDWNEGSQGPQTGMLSINLHIAQQTLADPYAGSDNRSEATALMNFPNTIHAAIARYSGATFSPLIRKRTVRDKSIVSMVVYIVTYQCLVTDNSGAQAVPTITGVAVSATPGETPVAGEIDEGFIIPL